VTGCEVLKARRWWVSFMSTSKIKGYLLGVCYNFLCLFEASLQGAFLVVLAAFLAIFSLFLVFFPWFLLFKFMRFLQIL
jgi:hypothetical protein